MFGEDPNSRHKMLSSAGKQALAGMGRASFSKAGKTINYPGFGNGRVCYSHKI